MATSFPTSLRPGIPQPPSPAASYRATFSGLGATALFGAAVAYGSLLTSTQPTATLAWAAACFVCGAVAAAAMSIITDAEQIDLTSNMHARRIVRAYAIGGAILVFAGLVLLSVCVYRFGEGGGVSSTGRKASAVFAVVMATVQVVGATFVRFHYARNKTWRF